MSNLSTTGSVINARDFDSNVTNPNRDLWNGGAMRHLIAALDGGPVAIVTDKLTGFTEVNVILGGVRQSSEVRIDYRWDTGVGEVNRIWHHLTKIGTVVILGHNNNARWTAFDTYRTERMNATLRARDELAAELGTEEIPVGKWSCTQGADRIDVYFRSKDRQVRKAVSYRPDELVQASATS